MFVINQIDLIDDIKKEEDVNNIVKDFSKEINDIYIKITSQEWNKQLKYSEIVLKDQK